MRLVILFLLVMLTSVAFAQKRKKKSDAAASTVEPFYPQQVYAPKEKKKKKKGGPTYTAQSKYYERIDGLAKTRKANERNGDNPRYTDPQYFGHKRPPKKRAPEKMKFCKVCRIRH